MKVAKELLALTYCHSAKRLPELIEEILIDLPGGEDWINRKINCPCD
ncbi:hypothetical protein ACE1B6_18835 [Aerosakkonemataceae cyanobacterium BLCC-F154]|uniref:Uncharacterized protein n=1 Tax=Floridaenema fluviatile BLCC-F154 TaxID=3153640 RepID=A0ABV4YER5_9CYAN